MNRMKKGFSLCLLLTYLLGIHKGYVALYECGKEEPRQIYPCAVKTLPEADQKALAVGIHALNDEQLQQLLEDYLS